MAAANYKLLVAARHEEHLTVPSLERLSQTTKKYNKKSLAIKRNHLTGSRQFATAA
jgi:hypothetical protein